MVVGELGQGYVRADEAAATSARDPFSMDPSIVDRGLKGHAATQNALADMMIQRGHEVRSPSGREPQYDLAWFDGEFIVVAEVKSLTAANAERQLRLGLGQVLRYRQLLSRHGAVVRPVLAVEGEPKDPSWLALCDSLGVTLAWPPNFSGL
jgi:hypothetical protein